MIGFGGDGSVDLRPFVTLEGQRALALGVSGTLYSGGGDDTIIWSIDPRGTATVVARGLSQVEGLAVARALPGDDGADRLPLGTLGELPVGPRLDFLQEFCDPGCFRDAMSVDNGNSTIRVEGPSSDAPATSPL